MRKKWDKMYYNVGYIYTMCTYQYYSERDTYKYLRILFSSTPTVSHEYLSTWKLLILFLIERTFSILRVSIRLK